MPTERKKRRVIAYVDGFNLYYGILRARPDLKWLDLMRVVRMLYPHDEVIHVKYFTAKVDADDPSSEKRLRQERLWEALKVQGVQIFEGRLEERRRLCRVGGCNHPENREYVDPVEKMTDVNMALNLVIDTIEMRPDVVAVISADTDMLPAIKMVKEKHACTGDIFLPCTAENYKHRRVDCFSMLGWTVKRLPEGVLEDCRLPNPVVTADGERINAPWHVPTAFEIEAAKARAAAAGAQPAA